MKHAVNDSPADRQNLKRRIRQLESIAALSGGIAHDYNNLLTAIMGNISLALEQVQSDSKVSDLLEQALAASRVAKTLTRRLITFSKGGQPTKKPTDIVNVIENTAAFSLSGSNIRCEWGPSNGTWSANIDAQQIGQAIHNLMINAAESMPSGGTVSISFENTMVDSPNSILAPGRYVDIAIQDQGVGIPAEHIEKIFDPYFSTKAKGAIKGTGLGLSISHSIISSHGGEITVCSRVGVGTTFHVLLPASQAAADLVQPVGDQENGEKPDKPVMGQGRILVMDDEAMIRELTGNILGHLGYDADFAEDGQCAVTKYRAALEASTPYDAVILDLTIKGGMGGQETIEMLKQIDPSVKAIVSSGYSDNPVIADYKHYGFCEVVAKPYEMVEFSQKLYRVVNDE
ncbi:ATP-binding protein [Desulfosarcina sp.]|uniref:hybrid sensor histidine kinase/response regulator n=1 Tax=Desulfosarcina sp. TaxID=2027861 RepID=UPI00356AE368